MGVNLNPIFEDAPCSSIQSPCLLWLSSWLDLWAGGGDGGVGVKPCKAERGGGRGVEDGSFNWVQELCQLPPLPKVLVVRRFRLRSEQKLQALLPLSALR